MTPDFKLLAEIRRNPYDAAIDYLLWRGGRCEMASLLHFLNPERKDKAEKFVAQLCFEGVIAIDHATRAVFLLPDRLPTLRVRQATAQPEMFAPDPATSLAAAAASPVAAPQANSPAKPPPVDIEPKPAPGIAVPLDRIEYSSRNEIVNLDSSTRSNRTSEDLLRLQKRFYAVVGEHERQGLSAPFFNEQILHEPGKVEKVLERFAQVPYVVSKPGAWMNTALRSAL